MGESWNIPNMNCERGKLNWSAEEKTGRNALYYQSNSNCQEGVTQRPSARVVRPEQQGGIGWMPDPPQCIWGLGPSSTWQSCSLHHPIFPLMGFPDRNSWHFSQSLSTCLPASSFLWWPYCFLMATLGQSRCLVNTEPRISKLDHINGFEVFSLSSS